METRHFRATLTFRGHLASEPGALAELRDRLQRAVETHPTLSFRLDGVELVELGMEVVETSGVDHLRAERRPMWCDDFDGDLYRLLPEAEEILAPLAGITLSVHSDTTHGRINCPSAWEGEYRLESPFGYRQPWRDMPKPAHYATQAPLIECTAEEAARDLWSHQHAMYVDGVLVEDWGRLTGPYFTVLFAARDEAAGKPVADAEGVERCKEILREGLRRYVARLLALVQTGVVEPYPFPPLTPEEAGDPPDDIDEDEPEYGDDEDEDNDDWDEDGDEGDHFDEDEENEQ